LTDVLRTLGSWPKKLLQISEFQNSIRGRLNRERSLRHFSPEVTGYLMRINAALAQVTAADIWPASAEVLRFNAQVGTIHYSTLIEGNRLGVLEAEPQPAVSSTPKPRRRSSSSTTWTRWLSSTSGWRSMA